MMQLKRAKREKAKLKIGLFGPAGSGKTMTALLMAYGLCQDWSKIAVIDTEHGSASLYAHLGAYQTIDLVKPFSPERYIEALQLCEKAGVEAVIVDSITHEWAGSGGLLSEHEKLAKARGNSFTAWAEITPRHNAFIDSILSSNMHVLACCRTKTEYILTENEKGRQAPQKVGLKGITRDDFDYEMTVCFDLSLNHLATCSKDRTGLFADTPARVLSQEDGALLAAWANSGADPVIAPMDAQTFMSSLHTVSKEMKIPYSKAVQMVSGGNLTNVAPEKRLQVLADFKEGRFNNDNSN